MKRKIFGIFLFAALALTCLFSLSTEAKAADESDLTFKLNADKNSYCVSRCKESAVGVLTIPATYQGKPVQAQTSRQQTCKCSFPPYLFRWHFPHSCAHPVGTHQYLPGKRSRKEKSEVQRRSEVQIVIETPNILEKKHLQFVS